MRKFSLVILILGVLDFILSLIFNITSSPTDLRNIKNLGEVNYIFIVVYTLFLLSCLLYYLWAYKLKNRIIKFLYNPYLSITGILMLLHICFVLFFLIVNIPTLQDLKPITIKYQYSQDSKLENNYNECLKLFNEFDEKIKNDEKNYNFLSEKTKENLETYNYEEEHWDNILKDSNELDNKIRSFLLGNIIQYPVPKVPNSFREYEKIPTSEQKIIVFSLNKYFKQEVVRIKRDILIRKKDNQKAIQRYNELWKVLQNLYNSKNNDRTSLLIYLNMERELLECLDSIKEEITLKDISVNKSYIDDIISKKDELQKESWERDFIEQKKMFEMEETPGYPIFNYNYSVNLLNDYITYKVNSCSKVGTFKDISNSVENTAFAKPLRILENDLKSWMRYFKNPYGIVLVIIYANCYESVDSNLNKKKGSLIALQYLLDTQKPSEAPVDPFSGRIMIYSENNGICEIKGYSEKTPEKKVAEEKPSYIFKVRK